MTDGKSTARYYPGPGDVLTVELPFSEVCMHMGVAGLEMQVRYLGSSVQLLNRTGGDFSFPILPGEAGLYWDRQKGMHYVYISLSQADCAALADAVQDYAHAEADRIAEVFSEAAAEQER